MRPNSPASRFFAVALSATLASGCMALSPQLPPTEFKTLEKLADRPNREQAYADNAIYTHQVPQGLRYTKGAHPNTPKRSWQSLDKVLRSDHNASQALPNKKLALARVFTALAIAASIVGVAGAAASAREGLDLKNVTGPGAILLGGGIAAVAFGITAGVFYGQARRGYEKAVDIYNDSLGLRLGITNPAGEYVPPAGTLVDEHGFVVLDQPEAGYVEGPEPKPEPTPEPEREPAPEELPAEEPPADGATPPADTKTEPETEPETGDDAGAPEPKPAGDDAPKLSLRTRL